MRCDRAECLTEASRASITDEGEQTKSTDYADYTFDFAANESGVDARAIEEIAKVVSNAGTQLSTHNWRSAS